MKLFNKNISDLIEKQLNNWVGQILALENADTGREPEIDQPKGAKLMNKKLASLFAIGLFAGPLSAHAVTSSCEIATVEGERIISCDLYESGVVPSETGLDFVTIDLTKFLPASGLGEGTVGIRELDDPEKFRNVVSFYENDSGFFLDFYFGDLLDGPYDLVKMRGDPEDTPAITSFGAVNQYRVHHDFRAAVPEPGSLALLGLGLVGLGFSRRRKTK